MVGYIISLCDVPVPRDILNRKGNHLLLQYVKQERLLLYFRCILELQMQCAVNSQFKELLCAGY